MSDDQPFRLAMLIGFALVAPVALVFRIRSQSTGERLDRRQEGLFLMLAVRTVGPAHMLAAIAFVMDPRLVAWASVPLPVWLRWVGVCLGAMASLLAVWAFSYLGKNLTDTVVTRREHTLVTSGPYRFVRHPFYVAVALIVAANSLATANWFIAATGMGTLALLCARTPIEEQKLIDRFGDAYRNYASRTGRFWPRLRR